MGVMKTVAIIGTSSLGKAPFVGPLIAALTLEGLSISCVKRAPDGFDLDQPGKASFVRRGSGAREVMLVGDQRHVLMSEHRGQAQPSLEALLARLAPVDLTLVEGFHDAPFPTIEVYRPAEGGEPRFPDNSRVIAIASDEALDLPLRCFRLDDPGSLCAFLVTSVLRGQDGPMARERQDVRHQSVDSTASPESS